MNDPTPRDQAPGPSLQDEVPLAASSPCHEEIQLLPDELIDQISAGEVVERPASVVRELIDNAVDAGAHRIEIEFSRGGTERLMLRDDGRGIPADQAPLALQRHATSKIRSVEDLLRVRTLGFRGEALPSIASISRFTLTTRPAGVLSGVRVELTGGRELKAREVGAAPGTCVEVEDLFFNVPVRRKFLRSQRTESGRILDVCHCLALSRPDIHISLRQDGREILHLPASRDFRERLATVFGRAGAQGLFPVDRRGAEVRIHGFLSPPHQTRSSSSGTYFFVNGRAVRDRSLLGALRGGYRGLLDARRHPMAVLFIELNPADVDVNVHPQKAEVRFRKQGAVRGSLVLTIRDALSAAPWLDSGRGSVRQDGAVSGGMGRGLSVPGVRGDAEGGAPTPPISGGVAKRVLIPRVSSAQFDEGRQRLREAMARYRPGGRSPDPEEDPAVPGDASGSKPVRSREGHEEPIVAGPPQPSQRGHNLPSQPTAGGYFSGLHLLGQLGSTYLVCEGPDGLVLIDQHAAHERVSFERLRAAYGRGRVSSQAYLVPRRLEISRRARSVLEGRLRLLDRLGFEIEPFGGDSFLLKSIPAELVGADPVSLIDDIIDELAELGPDEDPGACAEHNTPSVFQERLEAIWATMACHGSVRAGQKLSSEEQAALLRSLDQVDFRGNCPHGRPVLLDLRYQEIEKRMKRR